jgi:hypothetical protein
MAKQQKTKKTNKQIPPKTKVTAEDGFASREHKKKDPGTHSGKRSMHL